eukprot:759846-Hanusia_phi.AAC.4
MLVEVPEGARPGDRLYLTQVDSSCPPPPLLATPLAFFMLLSCCNQRRRHLGMGAEQEQGAPTPSFLPVTLLPQSNMMEGIEVGAAAHRHEVRNAGSPAA